MSAALVRGHRDDAPPVYPPAGLRCVRSDWLYARIRILRRRLSKNRGINSLTTTGQIYRGVNPLATIHSS
jgi:hypothetical protein